MPKVQMHETDDPVVIYDLMREAAANLIARYAGRRAAGRVEKADVEQIRSIRAQVADIDPNDVEEQRRVTAEFLSRAQDVV